MATAAVEARVTVRVAGRPLHQAHAVSTTGMSSWEQFVKAVEARVGSPVAQVGPNTPRPRARRARSTRRRSRHA
jgi:hypothetical protein